MPAQKAVTHAETDSWASPESAGVDGKSAGVGAENGKGVAESGGRGAFFARPKSEKGFARRIFCQQRRVKRRRMRNVWRGKREKR